MNREKARNAVWILSLILVAGSLCNVMAGDLEPTDPPGPTMHTLEEIYQKLLVLEGKFAADGLVETQDGMVLIPGGEFVMGDYFQEGDADELPLHTVYVSAFYMDQYETTYEKWLEVHLWATSNGYDISHSGSGKDIGHPVQNVNWYDCVKWANARSEMEGLTPCYYETRFGTPVVYRTGQLNLTNNLVDWEANGYRLPTEAEWEKAARGGVSGRRFPWADVNVINHERANYYATSVDPLYDTNPVDGYHPEFEVASWPYTSPVGSFPPNPRGLFDMAGNVYEWCWDRYDANYYASSPGTDPRGPDTGSERVYRSSAPVPASMSRCASRNSYSPVDEYGALGFRLVRKAQ